MKIALVQDQLLTMGGSEQVFQQICECFPDADIYTSAYNPETTYPYFKQRVVRISNFLKPLITSHQRFKFLFIFSAIYFMTLDLRRYDLIISSSATSGKYIQRFTGEHICYCYIPTRAIWDAKSYFRTYGNGMIEGLRANALAFLTGLMKPLDRIAVKRVSKFLAISEFTKQKIMSIYGRESEVLNSPIRLDHLEDFFSTVQLNQKRSKEAFLLVSRLERWKEIDHVLESFNISGDRLNVVGEGADAEYFKTLAHPNIHFLGRLSQQALYEQYYHARALIVPSYSEYGLTPLEALALATPIIGLNCPGIRETLFAHDFEESNDKRLQSNDLGIIYANSNSDDLLEALKSFSDHGEFDEEKAKRHVKSFSPSEFKTKFQTIVNNYMHVVG